MANSARNYAIKHVTINVFLCLAIATFCRVTSNPVGVHRRGGHGPGHGHHRVVARGAAGAGTVSRGLPDPSEKVFNVLQFGATNNPRKDSAMSFQKAWNAACQFQGKARLLIPAGIFTIGPVVFLGPCKNPSPIVVDLKGTLKAVSDISEFPEPQWIEFDSLNGVIITGGGTFDGQGAEAWKYSDQSDSMLPASLKFNGVSNGVIRGVTSVNPKGFHMHVTNCQNFRAHNLHLLAPQDSPNTDGIHISHSNLVKVSRSVFATGDDCVSIGQGAVNVQINRVTCGPGHGISVGSLGKYQNEEDVNGVLVKNCTLRNTDNGLRIKTYPGSPPSKALGIVFRDIKMENVRNPIIIDQEYGRSASKPSLVKISDVHFINIRGTSTSPVAVNFKCSKQVPCENVELANIDLKYNGPKQAAPNTCLNARVRFAGIQNPPPC